MKVLVVVDAQNDFVTGALANPEAQKVIPHLYDKIKSCIDEGWKVVFTQDTHYDNYDETCEGKYLPVKHCEYETDGWNIVPELEEFVDFSIAKHRFGSFNIAETLNMVADNEPIEEIQLVGFCTDICVVSNALILKASVYGEKTIISCDSSCCAGTSIEAHNAALTVMRSCQVEVR